VLVLVQESQHKFMAAVKKGDTEKVSKLTDKGLDPNFIDIEFSGGLRCVYLISMSMCALRTRLVL